MSIKLRGQKVTIDMPREESEMWVSAVLQKVKKDNNNKPIQIVERVGYCYRSFAQFATETQSIIDPVLGTTIEASGAGCALLVKRFMQDWILSDYPNAKLQPNGDILIKE